MQAFFCSDRKKEIRKVDKEGDEDNITISNEDNRTISNEDNITISYKIKHINSARFTESPLSNIVHNLKERIQKITCNVIVIVFLNMKASRVT